MKTEITVRHEPDRQRFVAEVDGHVCEAAYRWREDSRSIAMNHTEVSPALQGRGIAAELVRCALAWARAEGLVVVPSCSYVRTYMRHHRETQDMLAPGQTV
jgi:uncharacterized protein